MYCGSFYTIVRIVYLKTAKKIEKYNFLAAFNRTELHFLCTYTFYIQRTYVTVLSILEFVFKINFNYFNYYVILTIMLFIRPWNF